MSRRFIILALISLALAGASFAYYTERPTVDLLYPEPVGRKPSVIVNHPDRWILQGEFGSAAKCSCPHH